MAQVFKPSVNALTRVVLIGGAFALTALCALAAVYYRSPVETQVAINKQQPVPFSHQRHVGGNGIDCRYCHTTVEKSNFAGIPPTETCMTCHSQILVDAPMLEPVRQSWKTDKPLEWTRVYDVPDFVYFDHSVHISKGVGCTTCHGQIDNMPLTRKVNTLYMGWCLDCHRAPEKYLRPKEEVFSVDYKAPRGEKQLELGRKLVDEYDVRVGQLTDCAVCHR